ncbi:MAG: 30S ribosomal protein S19 [Candidatus Thermoplasmatota archaeon]|nr:30S ribosomal protein S19 [Candidatus Thermoplasmatota archaeon]MCL5984010.1 30S ribosomal protein S19 [Candidatus Thermoplasmatota archaeon]
MARKAKKSAIDLRKKKEFSLRGLSLEQLQKLTQEELMKILPSRQRRTLRRGLNDDQKKVVSRIEAAAQGEVVRTHNRDVLIYPSFIGKRIAVFSGKEFKEVDVRPEMVGHYLGEFVLTRRFEKHSGPGVGATRSSKFLPLK